MRLKKRRIFFTIMRIITLFVAGMLVALFVALSQVNLETLRGNVLAILRDATGLPVEIEGAVSWKFSLRPRIELNQVRVLNADWAKHQYAFSAEKIDVTINLISLFQDRPTIQNVKIYDATMCVEQNAAGEYSVQPFAGREMPDTDDEAVVTADTGPGRFPFEDPGLGGVEIRNLVAHVLDKTYSLAGLQIRYVPAEATREYSGWIKFTNNVYPFIVSYSEYNAERKIYPVRVALSTGGDALIADIALEGTSKMPIDFVVRGDIPDVAAIGDYLNVDLSVVPMVTVDLAGGLDRGKIKLRRSLVNVRGTDIFIWGDYDWSKKVPVINANIEAKNINLMELFPQWYAPKRRRRLARPLNVFKDINLYGDQFLGVNFNLNADIGKLAVYRDMVIRDLDLRVNNASGRMRIDLAAGFAGGDVRAGADVDIDNDGEIHAVAAGQGQNISVGEILNQINVSDWISDLPANFEFYVRGRGHDLSEVMQTLTGPAYVYSVGAGYAHSALVANVYGTDFLTSLRHGIQDLFRSEKKYNQIKISCATVNAKIRNGRIETQNGVAVETNAINLRLAGNLDLGDESMKLALTTVPVRGLKLSLTGNVMNSIEITGNLAEPDIRINGAAVAGRVASATGLGMLLAPFTGGLSLVAGAGVGLLAGDLLENWLADDTPCKTAMARGAPDFKDDPEWLGTPMSELIETVLK